MIDFLIWLTHVMMRINTDKVTGCIMPGKPYHQGSAHRGIRAVGLAKSIDQFIGVLAKPDTTDSLTGTDQAIGRYGLANRGTDRLLPASLRRIPIYRLITSRAQAAGGYY